MMELWFDVRRDVVSMFGVVDVFARVVSDYCNCVVIGDVDVVVVVDVECVVVSVVDDVVNVDVDVDVHVIVDDYVVDIYVVIKQ